MKKIEIFILSLLIIFYFFWFAIPTSLVGCDDFRMADVFNVDESEMLQVIKPEIKSRGFNMRFYNYGHLYYNTGILPLVLRDIFSPVSEQDIIILFRLLSALYFTGVLLIVFFLAKRYFGKITAWISVALFLLTSPKMYFYSAMLHPDTAQLFFIALSLYFCCRYSENLQWKNLAFAVASAGFAFSVKYAGIMLLPLIFAIALFHKSNVKINRGKLFLVFFICLAAAISLKENWILNYVPLNEKTHDFFLLLKIARFFSLIFALMILSELIFKFFSKKRIFAFALEKTSDVILLSVVFLCAFAMGSPGCVRGFNFVDGFFIATDAARYGHWFRETLGISGWLKILLSKELLLNYSVFALFAGGAILHLFFFKKEFLKKYFFPFLILFSWVIIYFTTLVTRINAGFAHYLLPATPFIIILSSHFLEIIIRHVKNKIPVKYSSFAVIAIPVLILGFETFQSAKGIYLFRNELMHKVDNSGRVKAGLWLQENYPPQTKILYDRYAYIPPQFNNCFASWGITQKQIMEIMPKLIFLNPNIYQNYLNADSAEEYLYGNKEEFLAKHQAYSSLLSGKSEYKLLKDFGEMKIYATDKEWKKNVFLESKNDYENLNEKWTYNNTVFDSVKVFAGKKSEKLTGEYSATFNISLKKFLNDSIINPIYINASLKGFLSEGASAMLVIDFIRNGSERVGNWDIKRFYDVEPDENNWRNINFCRQTPIEILPSDEVRIYVWNNTGNAVYLDDFKIEVYRLE